MEEDEPELYGIEDEFEDQFADELEVLAELEEKVPQASSHKVSEFRSRKRTFEEALSAGDLVKDSSPEASRPGLQKTSRGQGFAKEAISSIGLNSEELEPLVADPEIPRNLLLQEADATHTPKPKRQRRLEAVKKLDFGVEAVEAVTDPPQNGVAPPLPPATGSELQDARTPGLGIPDSMGVSGMVLLHVTPPEERDSRKVLKRPPILEDYINVTSTDGTRVFMVVKEDGMATELSNSVGWNRGRPLHLLGVPFSYLKEQVTEERRRQIRESSQQLMEILNSCLGDEEAQMEATVPSEEEGRPGEAEEDEEALGSLWVDRFTPRHYVELLSDDYTNRCLLKWLKLWDMVVFGKERPARKAKPSAEAGQTSRNPKGQQSKWKSKTQLTEEALEAELDPHSRPKYKVALLCGPPGLGKTTLAHVIVKHAGYNSVEMNASDDRSPDIFKTRIEAATQMKSVLGASEKPNCLIIDEIDGAPMASINVLLGIVNRKATEAESEGGTSGASGKRRRKEGGLLLRPVICICNDQYVPSLRLLRQQAFILNFPSTAPSRLVQRLQEITVRQGMKADTTALLALCEKAENDIRSCINTLQFLYSRGKKELNMRTVQTTRVGLKDQNKGLFSIWQEIFQLPKVQRQRIGLDPSVPVHLLANGDGDDLYLVAPARASLNPNSQRFHHILHLSMASGEHEKLTQGLYDNFLNMKVKGSSFGSLCLALEWLGFSDLVNRTVLHGQNFQLMRYLPFLPVAFHLLFAASNVPRLAYPNSQHEALAKLTQMQNLVASMISGIAPNSRNRAGPQSLVLEALSLLLEIISPKLRPVNTQLYSQKEKQQLGDLISTMLAYNLTYLQERTLDGQYVYKLDPNVEEVCRFPDLPARKPLTYQAKQLIAREIELEKMRRTDALLHARNSGQVLAASLLPAEGSHRASEELAPPKSRVQNHKQRLDQIVKRATFEEKPETDFFGRVTVKKKVSPLAASQGPEENQIEKRIGKAVGQSDIWFRFNEGVSNAVRRNIYIKDLF
ncbi:chromosome transmission fidelity protein 18 homolog [Rhineura floridana]|uniref:chromosome transmission fidelity protein 18 homolog n=1 Tax=Rhineura floridana TaxID=261503 RepID=UPI002AC820C0|nr:chromosome transmission fidelity protein 18 homolog [Rhineura floridana]XP_061455549.1 chromosome transmission fidelity protein 18 homolog [Rhineura floridana]XP_061455550.1 chromosome transmission fidelity protein 18 homolog [Rhineura floridana]